MSEKPFQLNPDDFKVNPLIDGFIKKKIKEINAADANHNGVPDIAEAAEIVGKVMPLMVALNHCVDFEKAAELLVGVLSPAIKDKAVFKSAILELGKAAERAEKFIPR